MTRRDNFQNTMKNITEYKKNGFEFSIIERRGDYALFCGTKKGSDSPNWEVIEIQSHGEINIGGNDIPSAEYAPGNNSWGSEGWTFLTMDAALQKLESLSSKEAAEG